MQDIAALQAERQQLVARIAEIDALVAAANTNVGYELVETTKTTIGREHTAWRVTHNGRPVPSAIYSNRQTAEDMVKGLSAIPEDYSLTYGTDGRLGYKFIVRRGDRKITADTSIDTVIRRVTEDVADRPRRAALAAEREAEAEKKAAEDAEAARVAEEQAKLASPRQVDYIMQLLRLRKATGEGGGFFMGPEDPDDPETLTTVKALTKENASLFITSLKGEY